MNKKLVLILFAFSVCIGLYKHSEQLRKDNILKLLTKKEAEIRSLCTSEVLEKRIDCLSPKLTEIKKKEIEQKTFYFTQKGNRTKLDVKFQSNYIKIKRLPSMTFGGSCVSTFFLFEFDNSNLYLSKDNLSGLVFCSNQSGNFLISSGILSDEKIKSELKFLLGI